MVRPDDLDSPLHGSRRVSLSVGSHNKEGITMKHGKDWFGVAIVFLLLSFLAGCATPPTKEELAALDYGACPRNYEKVIKERFQSGLLSAYAGEPIIWPPRQYWYKDPFAGGTLHAGYLVPVMAELTRGNQLFLGKQLYGFLFKNDELVREINPNIMRSLSIPERVGPFPKDERDWKEGHSSKGANPLILEYVLPGETVQNWSELVTVQIISGVSLNVSAAKFVADMADQHKSRKPGCATVSQKILASTPTEVLYKQALVKCAPFRDEYSIRKAIRGPRSLTEVSYSKTTAMSDFDERKWVEIVGRTTSINECKENP